ncbi:MAG: ABC transporter substrate-binding protein [Herpetosiphon sp.]
MQPRQTRPQRWILLLALALLSACGGSATPAATSKTAPKLTIALNGFENNITPFTMSFGSLPNTHDLMTLVYDTLFWSQNDVNPEPWLAERADPSEDRKVWTVKLRTGVTWHDGQPLTADDVKFSFDYYQKAAGASGRYAHHVSDVPPFDHAEVVDPQTVKFFYKAPAPTFPILPGGDLPIIPRHIWEKVTEPAKASTELPVGSGPYKVVEIQPNQLYRLKANESYFKGRPTVDELVIPIVQDPAAAFASLQTGQVDFVARNVPPELIDQFSRVSALKMIKGTRLESTQLYLNARKAPLSDARVRKAISLSIDSQALVQTVLLGHGRPGRDSFIHPDSPWAVPDGKHEFDVARANKMLDDAGYTNKDADGVRKSPDGKRLEFSVLVSSFAPQDLRATQLAGQQASAVGVKLNAEALDPATLRQRRGGPQDQIPAYDAYVGTLESHAHVDPDGLYYFFHSPGKKGFGATVTGYGNPKVDQLSEQAAAETDLEARKRQLYEIQTILAQEVPIIVYFYPDGDFAYRSSAYNGWVADPGHGIFTKRSFLPTTKRAAEQQQAPPVTAAGVITWPVMGMVLSLVTRTAVRRTRRRIRHAG